MSKQGRSDATVAACRICGGRELGHLTAREMMFGRREEFPYQECRSCGCVQISEYPKNIGDYYPADYYSYEDSRTTPADAAISLRNGVMRTIKRSLMYRSDSLRRRFLETDAT